MNELATQIFFAQRAALRKIPITNITPVPNKIFASRGKPNLTLNSIGE